MGRPLEKAYQCGRLNTEVALRPGGDELTAYLLHKAGFTCGNQVLDLGCGDGMGLLHLGKLGCVPVGMDLAYEHLAANAPAAARVNANAQQMPFRHACFDGILAECTLSLTAYSAAALNECARVLRPGGQLAITDICSRQTAVDPINLPGCLKGLRPLTDILAAVTAAGFTILHLEDHSAVLKHLLAQLILSGQCDEMLEGAATSIFANALRSCRPGYFLLIACSAQRRP